jgi:predicted metal-dependent phosphoesterase TrpH
VARTEATAGRIRVDMHLHTCGSYDCLTDPDAVVQVAATRGIDRVCVTDHNEIERALELHERYPEQVIVGEEVKTAEGADVIGLFVSARIPKGTPAVETCQAIHEQGGIVYVPHPFAPRLGYGERFMELIGDRLDVVEGFNGRMHIQRWNDQATAWARAHGKPVGAGSDAHTLREIGRGYAEIDPYDGTAAGFLAALRTGSIHGRLSSYAVHVASTWAKLRKRVGAA